ncbi:MAG TPA: hypothetical protein VE467_05440, partial [Chryseolinea sp.]|nr:hypothetical protein [Chryseolinea sp.]
AILFLPSTFILITQIILRPYFDEETHDLIHDWAYFTFYFCFFLFGMLCYSNSKLWESIGRNRTYLLISTIAMLVPFYVLYFHLRELIELPWSIAAKFWSVSILTLVSCILFYLVMIRPFNAIRFLFGMRKKK